MSQRDIPSIDSLLNSTDGNQLVAQYGHPLAVEAYRHVANELREVINKPSISTEPKLLPSHSVETYLHQQASVWTEHLMAPSLQSVFNLTGTVLHTNLGRAPMPEVCIEAMTEIARGACNLEYDLGTDGLKNKRGDRDSHVEKWLCRLTGAEAATVVNNNAAAVLLTLNSLASRRAVAVSRGELVEIGGSFRIPDIMKSAGCKLVETGTTNRTHLDDYRSAVEDGAVAIMRVHTSNYKIEGFTSAVDDKALGILAQQTKTTFINDLGSGALVDMSRFGLPAEATVASAIVDGAHVVTFSGDKLLGGPQCGLIVGTKVHIDRIKHNPMKRALRCDKLTLAALEAILRLYADPTRLKQTVPALRLLTRSKKDLKTLAQLLTTDVQTAVASFATVTVEPCNSQIGSGALPVDELPGWALVLRPSRSSRSSGRALKALSKAFRQLPIPVLGRMHEGALWLDLRCLEETEPFIQNLKSLSFEC